LYLKRQREKEGERRIELNDNTVEGVYAGMILKNNGSDDSIDDDDHYYYD